MNPEEILVGTVRRDNVRTNMKPLSGSWGPSSYDSEDHGEHIRWLKEYPESICDVLTISQHITSTHDLSHPTEENSSVLGKGEVRVRGICKFPIDLAEEGWMCQELFPA